MSAYSFQKYYLINLSTRTVSLSTHLRTTNFSLSSGKCIYLGELTDELVVKYHRYAALNISLRILTKDKTEEILNKCINADSSLINSLIGDKAYRPKHEAGHIASPEFSVISNKDKQDQKKEDVDIVQDDVKEKHLEDKAHEESKAELSVDDSKCEDDGKSKLDSSVPTEVDPFEESIKQDVKDMSYSQLCELAKARNIKTKGKVSRTKLIKLLSDDLA